MSAERVELAYHTDRSPRRIPIGATGTVVRRDVGTRGSSSKIVFVRWDNGDRSWHPTNALARERTSLRRAA